MLRLLVDFIVIALLLVGAPALSVVLCKSGWPFDCDFAPSWRVFVLLLGYAIYMVATKEIVLQHDQIVRRPNSMVFLTLAYIVIIITFVLAIVITSYEFAESASAVKRNILVIGYFMITLIMGAVITLINDPEAP